jgi:hypothetical protein
MIAKGSPVHHEVNCLNRPDRLQSQKPSILGNGADVIQFSPPPRQGFEFNWTILGIRYRVLPSFFLYMAILCAIFSVGANFNPVELAFVIAMNVACVFVALVFTEFVQGLVYRSYGIGSTVLIQEFFGGIYPDREPPTAIQRIAVALANPASCFLLFTLLYYSQQATDWANTSLVASVSYRILTMIAIFWGIIGLLPIFPYPMGRVMLEVLVKISPRFGLGWTLLISIGVAITYILYVVLIYLKKIPLLEILPGIYLPNSLIVAFFFGLTAYRNWQLYQLIAQQRPRIYRDYDDDNSAPWERR